MAANKYKKLNPLWWLLLFIVHIYRFLTKPFPSRCRFYPTCSAYAIDVLHKYGFSKATFLITKRISKCHPFHPGGVDHA